MDRKKGLLTKTHLQARYLFPYLNIEGTVLLVLNYPAPATHRKRDTIKGAELLTQVFSIQLYM